MPGWNEADIRGRFKKRAREIDARLGAVRARAAEGATFRALHDEMLAKLVIYDHLLDGTSLGSRERLLAALEALRAEPLGSSEALSVAVFDTHYFNFIAALIGQFGE